jgi:hypothetical protein
VSPIQLNNKQLTQAEEVEYLGIHLDRKLTWRKNLSTERKQLDLTQTTQIVLDQWPKITAITGK